MAGDVASLSQVFAAESSLDYVRQNPNATQVAGYRAWQAMGRQVRRGEKAIAVLAPVTRTLAAEDDSTGAVDDEKPGRRVVGFKPSAVFDIS